MKKCIERRRTDREREKGRQSVRLRQADGESKRKSPKDAKS